ADDSQDCLDDITLIQVLDDDLTDGVAEPETVTINTVDWNRARMTNIEASYDGVYFGEIYGDGIDGDCDGVELCFVDADEDGFVGGASGSVSADILGRFGALVEVSDTDGDGIVNCDEPLTTVATALWPYGIEVDLSTLQDPFAGFFDCNDDNDTINPNAVEVWYNNVDENCDNKSDFDRDGDGYDSREYTEDRAACPEAYINASFLDRARLDVNAALAVGAYDPVIGCGRGSDCNDTPNEGEEIYPTFNEEFADQENLAGDYMAQSADADLALPSTLYGLTLDEDVDADIGTTLTLGVKGDPEACEGGGDNAQVDNDCDGSVNTSRDCWFEVDAWAADLAEYKDLQVNQQLSYGFLSKEHYTACAQDYESGLYFVDRSDPLDFSTLNKDVEECDRLPTLSSGDVAWAGENDDDIFDFCWNPNWTSPNNSQGRYYRDGDGDLEGDDSQQAVYLCAPALEQEGLWISNRDDCDDLAAETNARGVELCDNTDNNCNDEIDEPTLDLTKALDPGCEYHYIDADADSWGLVVADATAPVAETDVYCICPSHELWDTTDDGVLEEQAEPETCPHYLVSTEEVEDGTIATDLVQYGHVIGGTCYVKNSKDCNDLDQLVKPFAPGEERYEQIDGVDNDCNFRMPLIELDCDDDNAFPFLPSMSEALLANPSEVPIASAADVGLETCDPNVSPPSVLCWGEQLPLACDSGTGFWTVSTIALESYGVFEGASRIPRKVDYNCSSWDCDDQCANRCEGADEACDGIDNDCNDWLEEFNQADLDGVPDPMASGEVMPGRVNEDELDLDQDNHIACNGVVSSNQNATTMRSCRSYSNFGDCNDLCMPSSPASEAEVCNGFLQPDACVDGEPADGDRDGYGVCGTFGVGDVVDEDLYVMVLAKGDLDAYVEDPETDDPPQIVPLIPPRVYTGQAWETEDNWGTVRECDVPLHTALEELTGELPVLVNDAVGMSEEGIQAWYGETRDAMLDVCVQADTCRVLQAELEASSGAAQDNDTEGDLIDPTDVFPAPPLTGDSELPSYCDDLLDVTCSVVKLRLDALGDEAMYSDASWDPDGCVYPEDDDPDVVNRTGGLYHPEQAITRSVWSQEQIVEARKLVVDFECYRLFGTYGCANGVYTSETTRGTWNSEYELAGTGTSGFFDLPELPSRLLESDTRWWLYLNRYQPSSVTGGTLAGCWGDPRPIDTDRPVDSLENISLTGGDCAEDNVLANRGMTEGPEDLLALYLGTPTSCDTCLDKIDNNCNGLIDAAEPACARCFVSQGYGCAGCSGTASSSTFGTTPTWVPLVLGMLLLGIRRREQS
ncbi:MAG: putative metal-binding motif-containing protein, partial [Myxococcota bacterium]